jgi:RHS repeat-associated protein
VKVTRSGVTTIFVEGLFEEEIGGTARSYYTLNGQTVAVRETHGSTSTVSSLHSDHLGSVSASTAKTISGTGYLQSSQQYDPWGKVRLTAAASPPYGSGEAPISQTARGFTGQRLDDTGLMHYNARLYDPALGRFVSADSIVPGSASGSMDGVAAKPLTVAFHETGFLGKLNQESGAPFWFQLGDTQRQQLGSPFGPVNPQALNRYSYVQNNPVNFNDPTGHERVYDRDQAKAAQRNLHDAITELRNQLNGASTGFDAEQVATSILSAIVDIIDNGMVSALAGILNDLVGNVLQRASLEHYIETLEWMYEIFDMFITASEDDPHMRLTLWTSATSKKSAGGHHWYWEYRLHASWDNREAEPLFTHTNWTQAEQDRYAHLYNYIGKRKRGSRG